MQAMRQTGEDPTKYQFGEKFEQMPVLDQYNFNIFVF